MKSPVNLRKRAVRLTVGGVALAVAAAIVPATTAFAAKGGTSVASRQAAKPTVVLVPGAWADGSSWDGVVADLQHDGYTVDVPPNPLSGVADDSAYLASYLATVPGPIVLVGQSYGGFLISNAATGNANVKALVYVDAFIPARGETVNQLNDQFPGSRIAQAALNFVPEPGGVTDVYIKPADFRGILANDESPAQAAELAATQRPLAASALTEPSGTPAWLTVPSWDVIGTEDHAIPVAAQEFMAHRAGSTVTKINAAHFSMVSHPSQVTNVIEDAARRTS
jgi:pimeloyl-ACP methyl ester carboxylesterase